MRRLVADHVRRQNGGEPAFRAGCCHGARLFWMPYKRLAEIPPVVRSYAAPQTFPFAHEWETRENVCELESEEVIVLDNEDGHAAKCRKVARAGQVLAPSPR